VATLEALRRLLERSDERDAFLRRILAAWRGGFRAGELAHASDYERGFHDGAMALKRAEHDLVEMARLDIARWGPRGREHFGDPRPGGYRGGPAPLSPADAAVCAGRVWLAGPVVHRHSCSAACRAYRPGWYLPADAARILATLPGGHAAEIARLRAASEVAGA
jgi:hypothetical protein